ncbi:MATE family efflux transporter [Bacillus atrophaeus]|uniref:MATE family efflux transporter n=1 Tax=Bacillus atrophaeus TaxID=1452 RepID=UPI000C05C876|nr:MATE family efflux transporter [Bacillus atrophaeus]ATO28598.1 MATE family efflux transporter [Bacillus atrophaeus]MBJ7896600.1 MATE family efflux transporter [Bacillus atrophaeus]
MKSYDFTKGHVLKQLVLFSTPILLGNMLQVSFQFIDSLWVGNLLGAKALGASAVSGTIVFTVLSFILGLNNATLTILSQQKGKDDEKGMASYINAFVILMTMLSVVCGAAGFFLSDFLLRLLHTPENMIPLADIYLKIHFIGILFLFGYNFISTVLRAIGDSKTPLRFIAFAVILNTVLAPVFISVFHWGIAGAAYATLLSQGIAFLYGLFYVIKNKLVPFSVPRKPKWKEFRLILRLGIPAGLQMMVISGGMMAIMSVVNSYGEHVVSGFGAAQRLDSIITLPAMAAGTAVNSMAGQNIGIGNYKRTGEIAKHGVMYVFVCMLLIAVCISLFGKYAIGLFIKEPEAVRFGEEYLRWIAFFYPFIGINFVLNGIVRASGAMMQVLLLNIISFWVLRYPFTAIFSAWLGEKGIGLGIGMSLLFSSCAAFLYYRYGRWKTMKLFEKKKAQSG